VKTRLVQVLSAASFVIISLRPLPYEPESLLWAAKLGLDRPVNQRLD